MKKVKIFLAIAISCMCMEGCAEKGEPEELAIAESEENIEENKMQEIGYDAEYVREMVDHLMINQEGFDDKTAELSEYREPVVLVRALYDALYEEEQEELEKDGTIEKLITAEAKVLNLWIRDTPLNTVDDGGITWIMEERYDAIVEVLGEEKGKELIPLYEAKLIPYYDLAEQFQEEKRKNLSAGKEMDEAILQMNTENKEEVEKVGEQYQALTEMQRAYVEHYYMLKEAERKLAGAESETAEDEDRGRIKYSGTRASVYGLGDRWLLPEEWKEITDQMLEWYPESQPVMVWIIGHLDDMGCTLEFTPMEDVNIEQLNEQYIYFEEPDCENHLSHEEYLNYFDEQGIKVYFQVEPGFADVGTLMQLVIDQYGNHECIAGFGVDAEWYYGITDDSGLPITDALAEKWDKLLKENNPKYRLFLKHYNIRYMPPTYRSDILFVNDSQGFGSPIGDALGIYDESIDDVLGYIPEFKRFADAFPENEVLYQIGYRGDAMWYYAMEDPIVQSLGMHLAEVTKQNCGIIWVDFTIKDPMTFPQMMTENEKIEALNDLLGYLDPSEDGWDNVIGKRLSGVNSDGSAERDALYVRKLRGIIDELSEDEKKQIDPVKLAYLEEAENRLSDSQS